MGFWIFSIRSGCSEECLGLLEEAREEASTYKGTYESID